ncbi:MAG: hypothetical protein Q4D92_08740 [Slackia sp.]|nr:hypothetical protein [Slackia sp.]
MDAAMISDVVLPLVFVAVGIALVWLVVELVVFLRCTRSTVDAMEAQITPILKDVQEITASIKPAADKVDPLVERVSLAVDAANLEIMRLDGILENVDKITETTASAANAVDTVANTPLKLVNTATEKLRDAFSARKASVESASLADSAQRSALVAEAPASHGQVQDTVFGRERTDEKVYESSEAEAEPVDVEAGNAAAESADVKPEPAQKDDAQNYFTYAAKED